MSNQERHRTNHNGDALRRAWLAELSGARVARASHDVVAEGHHLERAHVLSQPMAAAHVRTHAAMLTYGIRRRNRKEIVGQVVRLIVAGPGSLSGRYPVGNTGGAAISAFAVLPIDDDLRQFLLATPGARSTPRR